MAFALLLLCVGWLLYIGWDDFLTLKIRNQSVLILCALALAYSAASGLDSMPSGLIAGAVLFGMAFVFWLLGLVGAGDAKLYFPVGILIGIEGLVPYLVLLILGSILALGTIRLGPKIFGNGGRILHRLSELKAKGAVPYSIPMVIGTVGALAIEGKFSL